MRIAFYYAATWPWTAEHLRSHGVGGTETGLGNIARALVRRGHDVTVFNRTPSPEEFEGVEFRNVRELGLGESWDVFVCMSPVPDLVRVRATLKIHWSPELWREVLPEVHSVFSISPYHTRLLVDFYGLPPERIYTTCCPLDPEDYAETRPKTPGRLIFCSVPDRGLRYMPEVYRRIRREVPYASLVVTSDYTLWGQADPGNAGFRALFADLPGVEFHGRVPRPRLIELQATSVLHVYPCTFIELLCVSSLECQAAGTPTVATAIGALTSTVEDDTTGCLVDPRCPPPTPDHPFVDLAPETCEALAACVVELLCDDKRREVMARQARERAFERYGADAVAGRWLERFAVLARG